MATRGTAVAACFSVPEVFTGLKGQNIIKDKEIYGDYGIKKT